MGAPGMRRRAVAGVVMALVAALVVTVPARASSDVTPAGVTNVELDRGTDGVVAVTYDSVALGRRTTSVVLLPAGYRDSGPAWPTAYFLHGELGSGESPRAHLDGLGYAGMDVARRRFLLVAPDMDTTAACATCVWTNGTVAAESHLLDEVMPLVEALFNVRDGRAGRALLGTSMGGTGALIAGFRHPDVFGFIGALSALWDVAGEPRDEAARYQAYLTGQGLRPRAVAEIDWRNVSPMDLAPQVVAANLDVVVTGLDEEASTNDAASAVLTEAGLPHRYVRHAGARFASDAVMFADHIIGPLLRRFDTPMPLPATFSYKSADRSFDVWGYGFSVERSNTEFLNVVGASTDGTDFILGGTGAVSVTTPPTFAPGAGYRVVATRDPRLEDKSADEKLAPLEPVERVVAADADGRLAFPVDLRPERVDDEEEHLLLAGQFDMPHVRVEVFPTIPPAAVKSNAPSRCDEHICSTPAAFEGWDVTVTPWSDNPQVFTLEFSSPVLGLRARNYVHLPNAYLTGHDPFPVLYYLHGTVDGTPPPSGKGQSWNMGFQKPEILERSRFVVVSLDMNESSWCAKCWWIDDLDPPVGEVPWVRNFPLTKIKAYEHLHHEVLPLIESLFRVRTDRGGRGVIGNSMGGGGAVHNGFRRPDTFGFVGGVSGWQYDISSEYSDPNPEGMTIYFRRQGYPYRFEGEIYYRNLSPYETGSHVLGADVEMLTTVGDGCHDYLSSDNHCQHTVDLLGITEALAARDNQHVTPVWTEAGVPHAFQQYQGTHYYPDGDVYSQWYLDRINQTFATAPADPFRFSYKSSFPTFEVWDYTFRADRPNVEFLNVLGAQLDGRAFTLAGTGTVTVATPATLVANRPYAVRITDPTGAERVESVRADSVGRITLTLHLGPARDSDERRALVEAGQFAFPQTTVQVLEPDVERAP